MLSSLTNKQTKKTAKSPPTFVGRSRGNAAGAGLAWWTFTPTELPARVRALHSALPLRAPGREASRHSHCSLCGEEEDSGTTSLFPYPLHPSSSLT